ncbi:MAG TPA: hypothetical protein VIK72_14295 [Clostridiaceae bacterium]
MGLKDKIQKSYADSYMKRYGDRITQVQGNVVSVKIKKKTILWLFHKIEVILLVRQDRSKSITKCVYKKNRFFKKIDFIKIVQGNLLIVQGLKGKKGKANHEVITIINVRNLTNKTDLVKVDGQDQKVKRVQKIQRIK